MNKQPLPMLLWGGAVLALAALPLRAQVVAALTEYSPLRVNSQSWASHELQLAVSVDDLRPALMQLTGIARVGQHPDNDIHRNSFWVNLRLKNETSTVAQGVEISITSLLGSQSPLDGLSLGALSVSQQARMMDLRHDLGAHRYNLWGFTGTLADGTTLNQNIQFPIIGREFDAARYHNFRLAEAIIQPGEELTVRFMVTQNGPANQALLGFHLLPATPIPEPAQVGLVGGLLIAGMALWHRRQRRSSSGAA
jgi:hypothetical protein